MRGRDEVMGRPPDSLTLVFKELPSDRAITLHNENRVYCGSILTPETTTKEHVIGRKFVPTGKLRGQWNLIVRACEPCNGHKSDLEDDISAITMQPDLAGKHSHDDEIVKKEARRKARGAFSRRTNKSVENSRENISVEVPFGDATFTFNLVSPPQIDEARVFELARLQLVAFFYLLTYDPETKRGRYWRGGFFPVMTVRLGDWGNEVMRGFADSVVAWEPHVFADGADGFFKAIVRRHPSADCWSWAIEWNRTTRTIGFFGDQSTAETVGNYLPALKMKRMAEGPGREVRFRTEVPLQDDEDRLFFWEEDANSVGRFRTDDC